VQICFTQGIIEPPLQKDNHPQADSTSSPAKRHLTFNLIPQPATAIRKAWH